MLGTILQHDSIYEAIPSQLPLLSERCKVPGWSRPAAPSVAEKLDFQPICSMHACDVVLCLGAPAI